MSSFYPRPHAGGDRRRDHSRRRRPVSIHAPTRGATGDFDEWNPLVQVSIHAPTRGATGPARGYIDPVKVSIHAPTRGATSSCLISTPL